MVENLHLFLYSPCRTLLQQRIGELCMATEDRIKWLCSLEEYPFSLNTHYLSDYQSKFLAHYRAARQKYDQSNLLATVNAYSPDSMFQLHSSGKGTYVAASPTGVGKVLAGLLEIKMSGVKPEDLLKLLPSDPIDPALIIMADVRAYFQGKRFVMCTKVDYTDINFFLIVQWHTNVLLTMFHSRSMLGLSEGSKRISCYSFVRTSASTDLTGIKFVQILRRRTLI